MAYIPFSKAFTLILKKIQNFEMNHLGGTMTNINL